MSQKTVIVTGGTGEFFPLVMECVQSIAAAGLLERAALAVFDQGFSPEQREAMKPYATHMRRLVWEDINVDVPDQHRQDKHLSLPGRPILPKLFPGYDIYQWIDADAWVQTTEFLDVFAAGANKTGLAVAQEDGVGYNASFRDRKWWIGNYFLGFGLIGGIKGGLMKPPINNGVFAMHRDAPHWARYRERHQAAMKRTGKINLDQHSLHATAALDGMPVTYVSARFNWLPILSRPTWDADTKLLCEPSETGAPLSIIHLAGPGKFDERLVKVKQGGTISTAMNFAAIDALRGGSRVAAPVKAAANG